MHKLAAISQMIWDIKYRYRRDGQIIDQNIEDTWHRVAHAIAAVEKKAAQPQWEQAFYRILENFQFLPGGRILAGAGTAHHVTLFNCFVMNIAEDSLPGIFKGLEEGALTLQQGGGVGYDFSILRPNGDTAKHTGVTSSGPISFMRIWDAMCATLLSSGARRGAMMGILRCDHPDIEAFIQAKSNPRELRHFNVSVMVTDAFMQAVQNNADWALVFPDTKHVYRTIKARDLWQQIIRSAYDYAEPGVLFADTINRLNTLWYRENISATNPCGEIPLPPYGACNLGSINLTQFVRQAFTQQATIDWQQLEETTKIATRFLDNVIDVSHYPLSAQREQALGTRRIGLGITGLADSLVMLNIKYGSEESLAIAQKIMRKIAEITWETSIELAQEKNKFPFYHADYLRGEFVQSLNNSLQTKLKKFGVRNSHHNTIAPAGTISLLANNISNGIEPIFKAQYKRYVRLPEGVKQMQVKDFVYEEWQKNHTELPPAWIDTNELQPSAHLNMQAVMQPFIDNAISKTINLPLNFPFEKLSDVYTQAYQLGLKGCTVFRPNAITGSVLEDDEEDIDRSCTYEC